MPTRRNKFVEVESEEACPCDSGKTYGRCCKKRAFRWEVDTKGRIVKSVPIGKELAAELKNAENEFIDIFGRKPGKSDRVFFQSYYISERDMLRDALQIMKSANSPPSLVYAYKKTGLMVTKENKNFLTPSDMEEWNAAIVEYYATIDNDEYIDVFGDGNGLVDFMKESIRKNQIVGGAFVDNHFNKYKHRKTSSRELETVVAFATTSFVRTLKSIHILLEKDIGFDGYHLARSLYENYLTVSYLYANPEEVETFSAQLGTLLGSHEYARNKNGAQIQSKVVEIKTGKTFSVPSKWAMASSQGKFSEELYNELYRRLSSYCHSEIINVQYFITKNGFDYLTPDFSFDVAATTHMLCMLFFSCLHTNSPCAKYLKGDLSINAERSLYILRMIERSKSDVGAEGLPGIHKLAILHATETDQRLRHIDDVIQEHNGLHMNEGP